MKKILSMLLCCLLLAIGGIVAQAEEAQAPQNLMPYELWDFEYEELELDGYYAVGDVAIVEGGANGTEHALKVTGTEAGNGQWLNGLKENTNYLMTFWAKMGARDESAYPTAGVNGYNGDVYQQVSPDEMTEEWQEFTLYFKTAPGSTQALIYTWNHGTGNAELYLDEVRVFECGPNLMPYELWDFEYEELELDGYYAVGDVSIVEGGADGTEHALKVSGVEVGNGQWLNGLKPDTEYDVVYWAKAEKKADETYPTVGVNGYDGDAYQAFGMYTEKWRQYSLRFKTGSESTQALVYTWIYTGESDLYLDEVRVYEVIR